MAKKLKIDIDLSPTLNRRRLRTDARAAQDILDDIHLDLDVEELDEAFDAAAADAKAFQEDLEDIGEAADEMARRILDAADLAERLGDITIDPPKIGDIPVPVIPKPKMPDIPDIPAPDVERPVIPAPDIDALSDAFSNVRDKLKRLVDAQANALAQLALEGKAATDEWKELEAQLRQTQEQLGEMDATLEKISGTGEKGGGFMEAFFAGELLGGIAESLGAIEEKAAATRDAMKSVAAQTGLTGDALAALRVRADDAFVAGVGESVADAIKAIGAAQAQLGAFLNPEQIDAFVQKAAGIGKTFDKDVTEVIGKSRTLIQNFGLDGNEAGDLIALGMQQGGTAMDDLLDTTDEYSQLAKKAGFSAEEFVGTLTRGVQLGTRDTDKLADAIKETQIRLNAGDITNALKDIDAPIKSTIEGIVQAAERGDITVKEMLQRTAAATEEAFNAGQISEQMRSQLQIAVSGTPAEDIGSDLYGKIFGAPIDINQIKQQAAAAGDAMLAATQPQTVFEELGRSVEVFTTGAAETFAPFISGAGGVLESVGKIGPALFLLQDKFKIFDVAGEAVKKLIPRILGTIPAFAAQGAATGGATTAQLGLNVAMLANPAFLLVAGVTALVGAFLIFGDTTKDIGEAIDDVNGKLADLEAAQNNLKVTTEASEGLKSLAAEYDRLAEKPARTAAEQKRFEQVTAELAAKAPDYAEAVEVIGEKGEIVGQKFVIATEGVRGFADANKAMAEEAAADQLEALQSEAAALVDSYRESTENLEDQKRTRAEIQQLTKGGTKDLIAANDAIADALPFLESSKEVQADLNKSIAEESKKRLEAQAKIKEAIAAAQKAGKSQREIVEALGLSAEEAKKFGLNIGESALKAKLATVATSGLQVAAQRAKQSAQDLAAAYDKVRQAADSAYNNTFKAVLALRQEQRTATRELADLNKIPAEALQTEQAQRKAFLQQRLKDLPKEIQDEINAAREALKERRVLEAEEIRLKLQVGEIDFSTTDFREQAHAIRREIGDIVFELANESEEDLTTAAIDRINNQLAADKVAIKDQITKIREQVRQVENDNNPATVAVGDTDLIKALEAKIGALEKQADAERARAREDVRKKRLEEFKKLLADQGKLLTAALNAEVEELNRQAESITATDDESLDERLQKRLKALNIQQALEVRAAVESNDEYLAKYGEMQLALADLNKATSDEQRQAINKRASELAAELTEIQKKLIETDPILRAILAKFTAATDKEVENSTKVRYDREIVALRRKQDKELRLVQEHNDRILQLADDVALFAEDAGSDTIDAAAAERQRQLDRQKEAQLKLVEGSQQAQAEIEEEFARRSEELQEEAERRKAEIQARAIGIRLEAERQAALKELELQRGQLEEQRKLAEEAGQIETAKELGRQIDELTEEMGTKQSILLNLGGELQTNMTEVFTNLFAGNGEDVKSSFRKPFQAIAGALQQLATAKITEVLLGSIVGSAGLPGLLAAIVGRPLISAAINAIIGPVLDALTSFSTGGRVDKPTFAIVGDPDAARFGSSREWIFRDDQLRGLIADVTLNQQRALVAELRAVRGILEVSAAREFVLRGADIVGSSTRTRAAQSRRVINPR